MARSFLLTRSCSVEPLVLRQTYRMLKCWMSSVTVLSGSGSLDLRSPVATDTLEGLLIAWRCSPPPYRWVTAVDKHGGHSALSSCRHTLTHVHTPGLTWKREETVRHQIFSSCWRSPLFTERWGCCLSICRSVWHRREGPQVAATLANHKSSHCPSLIPLVFTCFQHTANSWLYTLRSNTHTLTHLSHWLVYQFACGMWEWGGGGDGDDQFKNTPEQSKSMGDFCAQVHGKVI